MIPDIIKKEFVSFLSQEKSILKTLEALPKGSIYTRKKKKGKKVYLYYVHQYYENGKRITKHVKRADEHDLKEKLITRKALLERLSEVKQQLKYIHRLLKALKLDPETVKEEERQRIRDLKNRKISKEKALKNAKNQDKYHNRIHVTSSGLHVRSKGEVILLELMDQYHIVYEYEKPLTIDGITFSPDVTIPKQGGPIFWEHRGMGTDPEYEMHWDKKKQHYTNAGIREGKNLIVTYDNEDGSIDAEEIRYLIEKYIL